MAREIVKLVPIKEALGIARRNKLLKGARRKSLDKKIVCARTGCKTKFTKRVHNQKYCSKECCQKATNEKLLTKYYENKKPLSKNRKCRVRSCGAVLSIYNKEKICNPCQRNRDAKLLSKRV